MATADIKPTRIKRDYTGLVERYKNGERMVDLAREYKVTRTAIYYRLQEEGVTEFRDERVKIDAAEAIDLYNQGMYQKDIAKHYKCSPSAITMLFKKHKITPRHKAVLPDLEDIDIAIPDSPKELREAYRSFQKDLNIDKFSKQLMDDLSTSSMAFSDDDNDTDDIEALLNSM